MSPHRGNRTGEDPSKPLSHFHPRVGGNKGEAYKILCVGKDKLVREVGCPLLKKDKLGLF